MEAEPSGASRRSSAPGTGLRAGDGSGGVGSRPRRLNAFIPIRGRRRRSPARSAGRTVNHPLGHDVPASGAGGGGKSVSVRWTELTGSIRLGCRRCGENRSADSAEPCVRVGDCAATSAYGCGLEIGSTVEAVRGALRDIGIAGLAAHDPILNEPRECVEVRKWRKIGLCA